MAAISCLIFYIQCVRAVQMSSIPVYCEYLTRVLFSLLFSLYESVSSCSMDVSSFMTTTSAGATSAIDSLLFETGFCVISTIVRIE